MMKDMIFADRYRLADFIGEGGMSLVYRAVDVRTGHSVAVKILKSEYNGDKEFLERFQREAQAASLMSHHNIVNLLDVGVEGEYRYLVLEYVDGHTLKEIIRQKGQMNTNMAIQVAIRILSALQHAHDNGIIHRDVKPQNVLMHADGHVKVADFGIARMTNAFTISRGDTVVGSVHYSSPEQASGTVADNTSDIYSTGIVLYEMLTGHVPFTGDNPVSVAMQHIKAQPPPILDFNPDVPQSVVAVVMRAMEKSPKRRYQSAREMADALIRARDGREEPVAPQPVGEAVRTPGNAGGDGLGKRPMGRNMGSAVGLGGRPKGQRSKRGKRHTSALLTVLMFAGVLGVIGFGAIQIYKQVTSSAVAPELTGLFREEAQSLTRRAGLNWQQTEINHETVPAGMVISQVPEPDAEMTKGDSVVVTVSIGPVAAVVPDLLGLPREEASTRLKERGFVMVALRTASMEPINTVISQSPDRNALLPQGSEVEVTFSGGSTVVPDVSGKSGEEAAELLEENGLAVGKLEYVETGDERLFGQVVAQSPTGGTLATIQTQVALTIAKRGKAYHSEVALVIPSAEESRHLRVVLLEGGQEVEQYISTISAAAGTTNLLVPVSSDFSGMLVYRAYLNDGLLVEREVELQ